MTQFNQKVGRIGEDGACAHLEAIGYRIVERNYRSKIGEIDIIAYDGKILCFIEVKTRFSDEHGSALESVGPGKQRNIIRVAMQYMQHHGLMDVQVRFDVVSVECQNQAVESIEVFQNAFQADEVLR